MPVISSGNVVDFRPVTLYSTPQRFKFKIVRRTQQRWDDRRNGIEDDACTSNRERPPQCCHHTKANEGELPPQYDKSANSSLESSGFFYRETPSFNSCLTVSSHTWTALASPNKPSLSKKILPLVLDPMVLILWTYVNNYCSRWWKFTFLNY